MQYYVENLFPGQATLVDEQLGDGVKCRHEGEGIIRKREILVFTGESGEEKQKCCVVHCVSFRSKLKSLFEFTVT